MLCRTPEPGLNIRARLGSVGQDGQQECLSIAGIEPGKPDAAAFRLIKSTER